MTRSEATSRRSLVIVRSKELVVFYMRYAVATLKPKTNNLPLAHCRFSGGDLWVIVLKNEAAGVEYNVPSSGIADLGTGRYTVTYSLPIAGDYVVWASLSNDFSGEGQGQLEIGSFTAS